MLVVAERKKIGALQDLTDQLLKVADGNVDPALIHELQEFALKMQQEKFYLSVVGMFKRGKSTIINSLLDKPLAPVAVTPLTAIITLFEYSATPYAEIHFINGSVEKTDNSLVSSYISEDENPNNVKLVSYVRVYTDTDLLQHFTLIDTPGLGSVLEHNTLATQDFIPKVDAVLFVLSSDVPVSNEDVTFLKTLKNNKTKILFTLNKSDLLGDVELQKIIRYNTQTIEQALNIESVELLPVSGKVYAINKHSPYNGIDHLKIKIEDLISKQKDSLLFEAGSKRLERYLLKVETLLRLKMEILRSPVEELKQKQAALNQSVLTMNANKDEFHILIKGKIEQLQNRIQDEVNRESLRIEEEIEKEIAEKSNEIYQEFVKRNGTAVQSRLIKQIIEEIGKLKSSLEIETRESFKTLLEQYSQKSQSFISELAKQLHSLMGTNFDLLIGTFDLNIYTAFYFRTVPDIPLPDIRKGILFRVLPKSIVQQIMFKGLKHNIHEVIVTNSAGTIYDLQYRIQESFRKFNYDLNNRLKELLAGIDSLIQQTIREKGKQENTIQEDIKKLRDKLDALSRLKEQLYE